MWKTESFYPKIMNKAKMHTYTTPIQYSTGIPCWSNSGRKINKEIWTGNKGVQLSIFGDEMVLYIKNPTYFTKTVITNK